MGHTTALALHAVRPSTPLAILLRFGGLRPIGPAAAEEVSFVLFGHGGEAEHAHGDEDQEEDDGNHENWHTSPLRPFWNAAARQAVIAITVQREAQTRVTPN